MTARVDAPPGAYADAVIAARLCAVDPGLGGVILRGGYELRDNVIAALREELPADAPMRRIPAHIDDDRLLGGLDLTATLARGVAVTRHGLLAEADGGAIIVPMAERLSDAVAARISGVIDAGEVIVERDGATLRAETRFVTVALDDGVDGDERAPAALAERMAFWIDLSVSDAPEAPRSGQAEIIKPALVMDALVNTAAVLGIDTIRAPLFALRAARASARSAGRGGITGDDLALAARLVLGPRATRVPAPAEEAAEPPPPAT